ncbi:MAG: MFS transporter [Chloroflexi bacterium]|nr:MFS transporter [Chloroflexota bacterium]
MNVTERISLRQPAAARLPSQKWLLAAVAFGTILAPLNSTMIAVALPKIGDTFHVGVRSTGWLVVAYLIGTAVVQPVGGKLGDMFGRRPIFLGALFVFLWFSVGGALAPNLATLLVMRVGQALTAAMAIPNAAALVREEVPEERRMSAYGIVGACAGLAASVGPPIGSAMIALSGWRSMFWLNIPVVVIAMYLAWRTFPKTSARASASGFDWLGVALLAGALTTAALLASAIERGNTAAIAALAISAPLCTVAFFVNEGRVAKPLVHLDLLRKPTFSAAAATVGLSNMAMYSVLLAIPLFIEKVKDPPLSSSRSGETLSWMLIPVVLLSPMAGRLSRRWGRGLHAAADSHWHRPLVADADNSDLGGRKRRCEGRGHGERRLLAGTLHRKHHRRGSARGHPRK